MSEQQKITVKPEQLENVWCDTKDCVCAVFEVKYVLKKVPATISPTGKALVQPISFYVCRDCGKPSKGTMPEGAIVGETY